MKDWEEPLSEGEKIHYAKIGYMLRKRNSKVYWSVRGALDMEMEQVMTTVKGKEEGSSNYPYNNTGEHTSSV